MANGVTVSHSVTLIHITQVMVIIRHNFWFYHIALFIVEISFLWWIMSVSQHADISLVHPICCSQVVPGPHLNVLPSQFVLHLRSSGMPFLFSLTVPQQFFFLCQVIKNSWGGKEIVHVQFVAMSFSLLC